MAAPAAAPAAACHSQPAGERAWISAAPHPVLICLFIRWSQFIGLLGKSIHIYGSGSAAVTDFGSQRDETSAARLRQRLRRKDRKGEEWRRCGPESCLRCERRPLITQRASCCYETAVSHWQLQLVSAGKFSTCWELHSLSFLISVHFLGTHVHVCLRVAWVLTAAGSTDATNRENNF